MSTGLDGVYFVVSLIATLYAASVFAGRLDHLGVQLGLPESLLGLLTAAAADAPELASAIAALATAAPSIGIGVVVGSNVFNLGAMIGLSAIVAGRVKLRREALALEGGVALGAAIIVVLLGFGVLPAWAAVTALILLLLPYVAVVVLAEGHILSVRQRLRLRRTMGERHRRERVRGRELWFPLLLLPPAVAAIVLGSLGMVQSAVHIGHAAGIPDALIGTLVLAVVTSLPNAYTGVRLGIARRGSALVSETMNSNTINLVGGIAIPALFVSVAVDSRLGRIDAIWLLAATALAVLLLAPRGGITRPGGALLLASWVSFALVQGIAG
jgi:cation:H+ antiporter